MQTSAPAPIASSSTLPLPSKKDIASIAPLNRVLPPDWRYEMRREAQEILPNLLIGPYQSSRSLDYMKSLRLTHVLCIQEAREVNVVKVRFPEAFIYKILEIRDAQDQNLIRIFPEAKEFIDAALSQGGRILVHCGDGISRSPAIVTAYVMTLHNMVHEEAFQYVQARRFCISPNQNFQHQIEAYQHIHEASMQIAQDPNINAASRPRRKRSDSEDENEEDVQVTVDEGDMDMSGSYTTMRHSRNVHQRLDDDISTDTLMT